MVLLKYLSFDKDNASNCAKIMEEIGMPLDELMEQVDILRYEGFPVLYFKSKIGELKIYLGNYEDNKAIRGCINGESITEHYDEGALLRLIKSLLIEIEYKEGITYN